jgi:hypothetical protein
MNKSQERQVAVLLVKPDTLGLDIGVITSWLCVLCLTNNALRVLICKMKIGIASPRKVAVMVGLQELIYIKNLKVHLVHSEYPVNTHW